MSCVFFSREYNAMSPTILSNRNYPLSPRSVFDNIHNRNISSPLNRSRMATETPNIFKEQSFDAQRAFSPPSGKYFSRIRPDFPQDSRIDFEVTNNSVARYVYFYHLVHFWFLSEVFMQTHCT